MSRIGRKPINIPAGVEVKIDGSAVSVKGPKGTLSQSFNPKMEIKQEGAEVIVPSGRPEGEPVPARPYAHAHPQHGGRRDRGLL